MLNSNVCQKNIVKFKRKDFVIFDYCYMLFFMNNIVIKCFKYYYMFIVIQILLYVLLDYLKFK